MPNGAHQKKLYVKVWLKTFDFGRSTLTKTAQPRSNQLELNRPQRMSHNPFNFATLFTPPRIL